MNLIIKINLDTAALKDSMDHEIRTILHAVASFVTSFGPDQVNGLHLRDSKGNTVGTVEVTE